MPQHRNRIAPLSSFHCIALCLTAAACAQPALAQQAWQFRCAGAPHSANPTDLTATSVYPTPAAANTAKEATPAFGFDLNTAPATFTGHACSSDKPFFFSIAVPDGNYQVTVVLGGPTASTTTVRAESRRLMIDQKAVAAGGSTSETFNVNVRTDTIYPTTSDPATDPFAKVKLKAREIGALDWDEKLTLEFNGQRPSIRSISIHRDDHLPTVYIAGDSTVVDQDKEPWAAWGQMLPVFFDSHVVFANEAESGETIRSFVGERRFAKVMSTIKPGDFLMIQFGHNDQKPGSGYVPAETDFKTYLLRFITEARAHGATPILVTPMNRRRFDADGKIVQTLGDYPAAMREVATQEKLALIDLNALSKPLFEALGPEGTLHAFVHYPAHTFPDQVDELKDDTHFNSYGAYELARAIVQTIRDQDIPLRRFLKEPIPPFNPAHPDPFAAWTLPPSPIVSTATPYGR